MLTFSSALNRVGGNGAKAYHCVDCDGLITHSDRLIDIGGTDRHLFVNPLGAECDFHTFYSCSGAVAVGAATEAQTWFPGYSWRMAFCCYCGRHLGWYYEAVSRYERPLGFWGILVGNLKSM